MSPSSFSTVSLINTASRKLCDSNSIPYTRGSPITTRYYFILVLMPILGSRVSPVELVPIFSPSGPSKLRSEGRGGPILLVSEGISFQFSPLWGSPATRGSSIASCHAYSLCGSGSCLYKVSGRPSALFCLLHDSVQSTHLTSWTSLEKPQSERHCYLWMFLELTRITIWRKIINRANTKLE